MAMDQEKDTILTTLNQAQLEAATHKQGPLLVIAGPGTGKTRVLTSRIAWLLSETKANPKEILAITFTNQAADEIGQRLKTLFNNDLPMISTFHSWAYHLLKLNKSEQEAVTPIDEEFAKKIFKEQASAFGHKPKEAEKLYKKLSQIRQKWPVQIDSIPALSELYPNYKEQLKKFGVCDFDELILDAIRLLTSNNNSKKNLTSHIKWILVDEFQDVSPAQYELLKLTASKETNITFIGDPCQSIYSFRGAEPELIQHIQTDFPNLKTIYLNKCYRCPQNFLDGAYNVLQAGTIPFPMPKLISTKGQGKKIGLKRCKDEITEARWIARTIDKLVGGLSFDSINFGNASGQSMISFNEIAVLYRLNTLGDIIENELELHGIPVKRPAKAVKSINSDLKKVYHLWEIIHNKNRLFHVEMLKSNINPNKLSEPAITKLTSLCQNKHPADLLLTLAQYLEIDPDTPALQGLLKRITYQQNNINLSLLLRDEVDLLDLNMEAVSLLTLHAAKGLEFPVVFLAGCENGLIPWKENPLQDEERRLFYVGLTRSEQELYISYTKQRSIWGPKIKEPPSPFIKNIPDNLIKLIKTKKPKKPKPKTKQLTLFD